MVNYKDDKTSQYNEAMLQIQRLHNTWLSCKNAREKGKLIKYMWILDSAEIELINDIIRVDKKKGEDDDKWLDLINTLNKEIKTHANSKNFPRLYSTLIEKEKSLKQIQEEAGKGSKLTIANRDGM